MRRAFFAILIVGVAIALGFREYRLHHARASEEAFVGAQGATVWNSIAEIRKPVANLTYGQHVQIYQHYAQEALVSTPSGIRGWVSAASLMDPEIWHKATLLADSAKSMPVQAIGHTRALTNLHTEPGIAAPVIVQALGDSPLVVLEHATAINHPGFRSDAGASAIVPADWWLVRAQVKDAGAVVGWALDRLISLDLPEPLPEYESSENMNIVAWFRIDRAIDKASGAFRPEYLVAGMRGQQRGCDFALLRVYTWSSAHQRYETAFVDSHVCGRLPILVQPAPSPAKDAYFSFENVAPTDSGKRTYRMRATTVSRIDANPGAVKDASKAAHPERGHS